MPGPIRVGVVDDHPSILAAVSAAVDEADDLVLSGTGHTLNDALLLLPHVDVLLCDVQLEGQAEGIRVLEAAGEQRSMAAVLLLSGHGHPSVVRAAVERGAAGYLDKSVEVRAIMDAIRTVAAGGTAFRAADLAAARATPRRPSERELQVIAAVVSGRTNTEIATALGVSEKTVETHLHRLFDRYGLMSRTELAADPTPGALGEPPPEIGAAAFRIAALALDNVVRHAPGSAVVVDVRAASGVVDLSICDDGSGFGDEAVARARASGRRGLTDMAAEADECGGTIDVAPGPSGVGTCVRFGWQSPGDR